MIVYYVCEVVRGHSVRLDQNVVLEIFEVYRNVAEHFVVIRSVPARGNVLTYDVRFASVDALLYFGFRKRKTVLVVFGRAAFVKRAEPFLCAEAIVRVAALYELLRVFEIYGFALRLNVRTAVAAYDRAFVVVYARFVERGNYNVHRALYFARLVGVFYAKNKLAAVLFGEKIGIQRRAQPAYMKIARGARCKSCAYHGVSLLDTFRPSW